MVVGGRPEVPGYLRDQTGHILRSLESAESVGTTAYRGVLEEVGVALYRSGTWVKANPWFTDQLNLGNPDCHVNHLNVLRDGEESSRRLKQTEEHVMIVDSWPCKVSSEVHING
jgi:protein tyrosine/serine phosphatase